MSILDRYRAYVAAFEETYVDDDWSRIAPFFTEDAVYETQTPAKGRQAVLAALKHSVDTFDRRMDERLPDFADPTLEGNAVTLKWRVTYTKAGLPDVVFSGSETAEFEGDQIARLTANVDPEAQSALQQWLAAHGAALENKP
ncbi:MAG: nuclear transport factor 2 family protein [Proteobacteria bacterium]|nr:nuclear transport factor 2 family protein [Pseudomonadota bacterium]